MRQMQGTFAISNVPSARYSTIPIAHRGAHGFLRPENSLEALQYAIELGAPFVEFDVWHTRTGQLVVSHDRPQHPMGWRSRRVGSRRNLGPPPLEPFLEAVAQSESLLNLDWKGWGLESRLVDLLSRYGLSNRTIVSSADPEALMALKRASSRVVTGLSVSARRESLLRLTLAIPCIEPVPVRSLGCNELENTREWLVRSLLTLTSATGSDALMLHHELASLEVVMELRALGAGVFLWTASDLETFEALDHLGVDGIATDIIAQQLAKARPSTYNRELSLAFTG